MDRAGKDRAAARVGDAHQVLHHLGGGRDLDAADRAVHRLGAAVRALHRRVGLVDRRGRQRVGQVLDVLPPAPRLPQVERHRFRSLVHLGPLASRPRPCAPAAGTVAPAPGLGE